MPVEIGLVEGLPDAPPAEGDDHVVELDGHAGKITVLVNGTALLTGTDSFNSTATQHGLLRQQTLNNSRHDNFLVRRVVA